MSANAPHSRAGRTHHRAPTLSNDPACARLGALAALTDAATLRPAVERTYPLRASVQALSSPAAGGAQGEPVVDATGRG